MSKDKTAIMEALLKEKCKGECVNYWTGRACQYFNPAGLCRLVLLTLEA